LIVELRLGGHEKTEAGDRIIAGIGFSVGVLQVRCCCVWVRKILVETLPFSNAGSRAF
jgi:hypothetical protein